VVYPQQSELQEGAGRQPQQTGSPALAAERPSPTQTRIFSGSHCFETDESLGVPPYAPSAAPRNAPSPVESRRRPPGQRTPQALLLRQQRRIAMIAAARLQAASFYGADGRGACGVAGTRTRAHAFAAAGAARLTTRAREQAVARPIYIRARAGPAAATTAPAGMHAQCPD
jgi:hypothetical protein